MPGRSIAGELARPGNDIAIRLSTAADASFERALFDEERGAQFLPLGLDGSVLATLLDQQFRAQQIGTRTTFPDAEHFIIGQAGSAVGRLTTALHAHGSGPALHVISIVLSGPARGRGIGTAVMSRVEEAALDHAATRMTLSVLRGNDGARRFYERLGFRAANGDDASAYAFMVKPLA